MAGTIGAMTNNTLGVAGINWNVRLMVVQGLNKEGGGSLADLVNGIRYAVDNGADVINMSWGGQGALPAALRDVLDHAHDNGVITVAAAGNSNVDAAGFYPASHDKTLTIAAWCPNNAVLYNPDGSVRCTSTPVGSRASFSNYGAKIDVIAPGVDVLSLRASGTDMYCLKDDAYCGERIVPLCADRAVTLLNCPNYVYYRASGTSMAAPHVSGVAALLRGLGPNASPDLVRTVLRRSAEDVLTPGRDDQSGHGLLRADAAVTLMKNLLGIPKSDVVVMTGSARALGNGQVLVESTIANQGLVAASNISYSVAAGQQTLTTGTVAPLTPGQQQEIQVTMNLPVGLGSSTFTITAAVPDPNTEWFTDNNSYDANLSLLLPGWSKKPASGYPRGDPALGNLDSDPGLEVIVPYDNAVYAWNADGGLVPGWPISTAARLRSTVAVADLNNDGVPEIVAGGDGQVFVWRRSPADPSRWENQPGWPQPLLNSTYYAVSSPVVVDLDRNGTLEILMGDSRGGVYAWRSDGTAMPGWPQAGTGASNRLRFGLAADDVDGDGTVEIVSQYESATMVAMRRANGSLVPGWPKTTIGAYNPGPVIADLNGDGKKDVIANAGTKLYAWGQPAGTWVDLPGWPKTVSSISYLFPPVAADIAGDSKPEIIVAPTSRKELYAYNSNGTLLTGWPKAIPSNPGNSAVVANVDGQGRGEIIFVTGSNAGQVFVWRTDATSLLGWPQSVPKTSSLTPYIKTAPVVGDVDGDGRPEVAAVDEYHGVGVWKIAETSSSTSITWPTSRQNILRTGRIELGSAPGGGGGSKKIPVE